METWVQLKKYLRSKKVGDIVTRYDIQYHGEDDFVLIVSQTINGYIDNLLQAGVLLWKDHDTFEIVRRLHKKARITDIRNMVKGDWRSWFLNEIFDE